MRAVIQPLQQERMLFLKQYLEDDSKLKVVHNAAQVAKHLAIVTERITNVFDTQVLCASSVGFCQQFICLVMRQFPCVCAKYAEPLCCYCYVWTAFCALLFHIVAVGIYQCCGHLSVRGDDLCLLCLCCFSHEKRLFVESIHALMCRLHKACLITYTA